jgi:hypothetical protein
MTGRESFITAKEESHYSNANKPLRFNSAFEECEWARTQNRTCSKCEESLPLTYFAGNTSGNDHFDKDGYRLRRPECIACQKSQGRGKIEAKRAAKALGLPTKAPYGTPCDICSTVPKNGVVFDHCHKTNRFRGWLCDPCNRSLGVFGDDVEGIMKVLAYLTPSKGAPETN